MQMLPRASGATELIQTGQGIYTLTNVSFHASVCSCVFLLGMLSLLELFPHFETIAQKCFSTRKGTTVS